MKTRMNLKQDDRRYNLVYRNQILVSNQPYIVCNGKKGQLIRSNPKNFVKSEFKFIRVN